MKPLRFLGTLTVVLLKLVLSEIVHTDLTPSALSSRTFKSKKELFESRFWEQVQDEYDDEKARLVVVYIENTNSVFYINNVNADTDSKSLSLNPFRKSKSKKKIKLTEVQYGAKEVSEVEGVPVSFCISSRLSSGGASYTQSYKWSQGLQLTIGPTITASAALMGATLSGGNDQLTLSFANSGSITCNADPGKRVQVFGSFAFASFPKARKRDAIYNRGDYDLDSGPWKKLVDIKSEISVFGAVFFDLTSVPNYYCVDDEEKLICDKSKVVDKNSKNPLELLRYSHKVEKNKTS